MRDNENHAMYNDRESVTLLNGDIERPCLRKQEKHEMSVWVRWRKERDSYMKEHAREMGAKGDSNIQLRVQKMST